MFTYFPRPPMQGKAAAASIVSPGIRQTFTRGRHAYDDTMVTGVIRTRAIIVHDLAQARVAAAVAADLGAALTLATGPGAAAYLGPGWACALLAALGREFPDLEVTLVFDCGDKPGPVLAALRAGLKTLRFTGRKAAARKLAEIAAAQGAEILTGRLRALDLGPVSNGNADGETGAEAACRRWLSAS